MPKRTRYLSRVLCYLRFMRTHSSYFSSTCCTRLLLTALHPLLFCDRYRFIAGCFYRANAAVGTCTIALNVGRECESNSVHGFYRPDGSATLRLLNNSEHFDSVIGPTRVDPSNFVGTSASPVESLHNSSWIFFSFPFRFVSSLYCADGNDAS